MVVLASEEIHPGLLEALAYARSISPDHLLATTVVADGHEAEIAEKRWAEAAIEVPLEIVRSATHEFTDAMLSFIDEVERRWPNSIVTVIIPELFVEHWWQHLLAQPECADPEGPTAVPEEHGRHVDSVPDAGGRGRSRGAGRDDLGAPAEVAPVGTGRFEHVGRRRTDRVARCEIPANARASRW